MPDYPFRLGVQDFAIPYLDSDGIPAVEAWGIDLDRFPRKKPADRQRFKRSLAEPLLLTVDRDAELIWKVVEGSH